MTAVDEMDPEFTEVWVLSLTISEPNGFREVVTVEDEDVEQLHPVYTAGYAEVVFERYLGEDGQWIEYRHDCIVARRLTRERRKREQSKEIEEDRGWTTS